MDVYKEHEHNLYLKRAGKIGALAQTIHVVIPAYRPTPDFPGFVRQLAAMGLDRIIIVDDGSGPPYRPLFDEVARLPQVRVERHAVNLGKGAALKTGFNAALCEDADALLVTADADGQHHPDDVLAVARALLARPDALVLGVRRFDGDVPFRSRAGNEITRVVMRAVAGQKISDTQTGLRGIPAAMLPELLRTNSRGYEFELDMLLLCRTLGVRIAEVPIRTIYEHGNTSSHFHPLLDSMRIYFVLLRFAAISLCSALVDNLIFAALFLPTKQILVSQILARIFAMLFNFALVRRMVFQSKGRGRREFLGYLALVLVSGSASYGLIRLLSGQFGVGVIRAKLAAEFCLFFVNFLVQRDVIFSGQQPSGQDSTPDCSSPTGNRA